MITRVTWSSLTDLWNENSNPNKNWYFFECQILRIIAPSNIPGTSYAWNYYNRSRNLQNGNSINYSRLFLVRVYSETEWHRLCYILESCTHNTSRWNNNVKLRDNGVLSIGTDFRILSPLLIGSLMAGDITQLNTNFPVVIMKSPKYYKKVLIDYQMNSDNDFGFCVEWCHVNSELL